MEDRMIENGYDSTNHIKKITQKIPLSIVVSLFTFAIGIIYSILLARVLGPEQRGIYTSMIILPTTVASIGTFSFGSAFIYYKIRDAKNSHYYDGCYFYLNCGLALLYFCIFYLFGEHLFPETVDFNKYKIILSICVVSYIFINMSASLMYASRFILRQMLSNLSLEIIKAIGVITLVVILASHNAYTYVTLLILATFLVSLYRIIVSIDFNKIRFSLTQFKQLSKFSIYDWLSSLSGKANLMFAQFYLAYYMEPILLGYYAIALALANIIKIIPTTVSEIILPIASHINNQRDEAVTHLILKLNLYLSLFISLCTTIASQFIVTLIYGKSYEPALYPFLLLLPGTIALSYNKLLLRIIIGRGKPKYNTISSISSALLNLVLVIQLVPLWSINGAALASSASYIVYTLINLALYSKKFNIKLKQITLLDKEDFSILKNNLSNQYSRLRSRR